MFTQLTLDITLKDSFTFDNFVTGDNQLLVDLLKDKKLDSEKQVYIWGMHNAGKTHILQALCQYYSGSNINVSYLPLHQLISYSPEVFQGQEEMDVCCIDDVQLLCDKPDWQEALFDLINRARENNTRLVISANQPPTEISIELNDLISRLQWGPVFKLNELSDTEKCLALQQRAECRGFDLADNVANYLLNNCHRDIADLFVILETLDKAQLQQHRRLTIPFVKSVLGD
ncbi:MAG: DnaA regulatory inactivator Hda [endosymbiont of Galathealinum brachiosum]|uniref:DnaA regulatory inactivator Hda n=1 Tax=endosymbiont of Galathealinum brachiosum TaxID=2200906 RepID=A0A370D8S6_9GAMM|nr:MAG: DnaA regulatory inactivator Hda [endosymbiont of Galathealinum brachiosum]